MAKAATVKKVSPVKAPQASIVPEAIPAPALRDTSALNEADRLQSLINLMKQLPAQYFNDPENGKKNLWAILRFEPTDAQLEAAREAIANEPKRNP